MKLAKEKGILFSSYAELVRHDEIRRMVAEVMAEITNEVQFPNGNAAATPLVDEAIRNDPGIYPTGETMSKLYAFSDLPAKVQRTMTRTWTKIKSDK